MSSRIPGEPEIVGSKPLRIVADLGNSRLKWGRLNDSGNLSEVVSLPLDVPARWEIVWREWNRSVEVPSSWLIASVNPPLADRLDDFLRKNAVRELVWYRSAADVPISSLLQKRETAGADRAIAVL